MVPGQAQDSEQIGALTAACLGARDENGDGVKRVDERHPFRDRFPGLHLGQCRAPKPGCVGSFGIDFSDARLFLRGAQSGIVTAANA